MRLGLELRELQGLKAVPPFPLAGKEEVGRARADEAAARDETTAARNRLLELERAMEASQREHDSFRESTERRLEGLRAAVEDEEAERGAEVKIAISGLRRDCSSLLLKDTARNKRHRLLFC